VLAFLHTHPGLSLDVLEILCGDEGYFADPAEAGPVPGPGTIAVTLQTATVKCGGRVNAPHLCTSFRSQEYALHETCHY
jgi:hypothetical protein